MTRLKVSQIGVTLLVCSLLALALAACQTVSAGTPERGAAAEALAKQASAATEAAVEADATGAAATPAAVEANATGAAATPAAVKQMRLGPRLRLPLNPPRPTNPAGQPSRARPGCISRRRCRNSCAPASPCQKAGRLPPARQTPACAWKSSRSLHLIRSARRGSMPWSPPSPPSQMTPTRPGCAPFGPLRTAAQPRPACLSAR